MPVCGRLFIGENPSPQHRRISRQLQYRDGVRQRVIQDRRNDIRCQRSQVDHPAHITVIHAFALGDFRQGLDLARLQHGKPTMTPGQGQLHRFRFNRSLRFAGFTAGQRDHLVATARTYQRGLIGELVGGEEYRALQVSYGMKTSMNRKGNCWDNAPMESFFGTLKTESLHHYCFTTREQARQVTFEYIEVFYGRIRRHAKIGNQVPADFANQFYANRQQSAA